jgi:plasmid stabilization system protein ParE
VRLRYSPRARADIADIDEYIAKQSLNGAAAVLRQIRATSLLLARYPGLGRQTDIPGVRVFPIARYPYLVYHHVRGDALIVIHVRHGRRDAPTTGDI